VCTFAYSPGPGHEPILFQGVTDGKIVPPRGPTNFGEFLSWEPGTGSADLAPGWDPIFEYDGKT